MQLSCNCCTKAEYFQVCYFLKNDKTLVSSQGTGWALLLQKCSQCGAAPVRSWVLLLLKDEDVHIQSCISIWTAGWGAAIKARFGAQVTCRQSACLSAVGTQGLPGTPEAAEGVWHQCRAERAAMQQPQCCPEPGSRRWMLRERGQGAQLPPSPADGRVARWTQDQLLPACDSSGLSDLRCPGGRSPTKYTEW